MRLIDADVLKEEVNKKKVVGRFNTLLLIDNAPTVDVDIELAQEREKLYEESKKLYMLAKTLGKEERPQGKWEYNQYDGNPNIGNWHCSNCHNICYEMKLTYDNYNFCPNCGARMKEIRFKDGGAE